MPDRGYLRTYPALRSLATLLDDRQRATTVSPPRLAEALVQSAVLGVPSGTTELSAG